MRYALWICSLCAVSCLAAGCGKSGEAGSAAAPGETTPGAASATANQPTPGPASPDAAVAQFYDALRAGNETVIAALLTDRARTETAKCGLDIRSTGSASLAYQVGEIDYVTAAKDGAHVKSVWTESDPQGQSVSTEVIWVLRKQANGWRIAGMATQVAEGQLPLLFNFEDPADMLRKKEALEKAYSTAEAEVQQAAQPAARGTEMR